MADAAMIERLVVLGGSGDLTGRYLLPGLAALAASGRLPERFELVGASREDWDDDHFRDWAVGWLDHEAADVDANVRATLLKSLRYRPVDLTDPENVRRCIAGQGPVAVYLALPPAVFPTAIQALSAAGLPAGSQVVLEKPFGEDLQSARTLNKLVAELVDERHVFRVDHFLAMSTVQNVLGTRLANRVIEPLWNSSHIEEIEIIWEESLALEGRATYYESAGALKDMIQNHLLQLLCLVAMEPPISLGERDLRDRKVDVLRCIRPFDDRDVVAHTRRARYRAGRVGGRKIPAYVDEPGVKPERETETFAEVTLHLDNWRWSDTRFRLRTGKAMRTDRKEVVVHFRPTPHIPLEQPEGSVANRLRFGLELEGVSLELNGIGLSTTASRVPLTLNAAGQPPELPAYSLILLDVLRGDSALSCRGDEAEAAWQVLMPIIDGWARELTPLEEYDAGSDGPARRPTP